MVQFEPNTGQVLQTFEHHANVSTDEEAPRWAASVIRDVLMTLANGAPSELQELAVERLTKVDGVIPRL